MDLCEGTKCEHLYIHVSTHKREALNMHVNKMTHQLLAAGICHQPSQCRHNRHMDRRAMAAGMEVIQGPLAWAPTNQSLSAYCYCQIANIPAAESDTESPG